MLMLTIAFVAGLFVGWNIPQPELAKQVQAWVTSKTKR